MEQGKAVQYVVDHHMVVRGRPYASAEELDSPVVWLGTPEQVAEKVVAVRERYGVSYFVFALFHTEHRWREYVDGLGQVVMLLKGK